LMRIRDGDSSDPGWKKVGSGIRDKHPGSATLIWGIGNRGLSLCNVASLVLYPYCIDAPQRIVKKSLYRTAPPYSIPVLNGKRSATAVHILTT
jgi:hypothetical protein